MRIPSHTLKRKASTKPILKLIQITCFPFYAPIIVVTFPSIPLNTGLWTNTDLKLRARALPISLKFFLTPEAYVLRLVRRIQGYADQSSPYNWITRTSRGT